MPSSCPLPVRFPASSCPFPAFVLLLPFSSSCPLPAPFPALFPALLPPAPTRTVGAAEAEGEELARLVGGRLLAAEAGEEVHGGELVRVGDGDVLARQRRERRGALGLHELGEHVQERLGVADLVQREQRRDGRDRKLDVGVRAHGQERVGRRGHHRRVAEEGLGGAEGVHRPCRRGVPLRRYQGAHLRRQQQHLVDEDERRKSQGSREAERWAGTIGVCASRR